MEEGICPIVTYPSFVMGPSMSTIAIKMGGSVLAKGEIDLDQMRKVAKLLIKIAKQHKLYIVVGGGKLSRDLIISCRKLGADESFCDEVGIDVSRINARVLISALGPAAYPQPAKDFQEAIMAGSSYRIVVMGGTHPGHSTDAVCAMLAEKARANRIVRVTNVDGVYTDDPKLNPKAELLKKMTAQELVKICSRSIGKAGSSGAFDHLAAKVIARTGIPTYVVNGNDLANIEAAILGKKSKGTEIIPVKDGKAKDLRAFGDKR
jgi:uridylate kinase